MLLTGSLLVMLRLELLLGLAKVVSVSFPCYKVIISALQLLSNLWVDTLRPSQCVISHYTFTPDS